MNIPNLPTDNLWKFVTFFGLIIGFAGVYFKYQLDRDRRRDLIEIDYLVYKLKSQEILEPINSIRNGKDDAQTFNNDSNEFKQELQSLRILADSLNFRYDIYETVYSESEFKLYEDMRKLGFLLFIIGIIFWLVDVQIPLDEKLKEENLKSAGQRRTYIRVKPTQRPNNRY